MRRAIFVVMATATIFLSSCSDGIVKENSTHTDLNDTDQSGIIKTEKALKSLLKSIKGGEVRKDVTLVGKLVLGSNPKMDPSKLIVGNSFVYFGHYLDKDKYNNQKISVRADIRHADGKTWGAQVLGHMIVNVQHVAMAEDPIKMPNIIFFLADDMGMGDTSVYQDWARNPDNAQLHTPAMDRLAKMGVRFTDAHSPSSRCSPSRYALMTGRYCWRTRLKHWVLFGVHCDPLIERKRLTMPEFLRAAGYQTGMVGKWHLGLKYHNKDGGVAKGWKDADLSKPLADGPVDHGFDFFHGISRSHPTSGPHKKGNGPHQDRGPGWMHNRKITGLTGNGKEIKGYHINQLGEVLDEQAFSFLKPAVASKKPFFLYFASPANHGPYTPSQSIGDIKIAGASRNVDNSLTKSKRLDFVHQNDVHIARLLEYLNSTDDPRRPGNKLFDNTLFIFSSDNGAEQNKKRFTGPLRSNKGSTYEGGHRVPFIATWPAGGIGDGRTDSPGRTCDRLLSLTDIFATFADILDKPLPPLKGDTYGAEDSVSQLAAMRGNKYAPRIPLFSNDHNEASKKVADERAWIAIHSHACPAPGKWKLFLDHHYAFEKQINPKELYELQSDQKEGQNLLGDKQQKVIDFLIGQAKLAAGDNGSTRQLER